MDISKMITIKDCAEKAGISSQAVYKKINSNPELFEGHVFKAMGKKLLDEYAVQLITGSLAPKKELDELTKSIVEIVLELNDQGKQMVLDAAKKIKEVQTIV